MSANPFELVDPARGDDRDDAVPSAAANPFDVVEQARAADALELTAAHAYALDRQPDRQAEVRRLQGLTGLPADAVEQHLELVRTEAARADFDAATFRRTNPRIADWYRDPRNAAVAVDDLAHLQGLEWWLHEPARAFREGWRQIHYGWLGSKELLGWADDADRARIAALAPTLGRDYAADSLPRGIAVETARLVPQLIAQALLRVAGRGAGAAAGAALAAAGGQAGPQAATPEELVTVPAGAAAGGAAGAFALPALFMGAQEAGAFWLDSAAITDASGRPLDPAARRLAALAYGAGAGLLEGLSLEVVARNLPGAQSLFGRRAVLAALRKPTVQQALTRLAGRFGETYATEVSTEVLQEAWAVLAENAAAAATPGDWSGLNTAPQVAGRLGGTAAAAAKGMLLTSLIGPAAGAYRDVVRVQSTAQSAERMQQLLRTAAGSRLAGRSPEAFEAALGAAASGSDLATVYTDVRVWNTFFQQQPDAPDPRAAWLAVGGDAAAYDEALERGADLALPVEQFVARLGPSGVAEQLFQDSRTDPNGLTVRQARALLEEREREIDAMVAAGQDRPPTPADLAVYEDVRAQLLAAGMPEPHAAKSARLWQHFFRAQAARVGVAPDTLYEDYELEVTREGIVPAPGPTPAARPAAAPERPAAVRVAVTPRAPAAAPAPAAAAPAPAPGGAATYAFNPQGTRYDLEYRVVGLDDLVTSHDEAGTVVAAYPAALQERDRASVGSRAQVEQIATSESFANLVDEQRALDRGAPIVGAADRVVESGNGRVMALRLARRRGSPAWQDYQTRVGERAAALGLSTAGVTDPVLVRVRAGAIADLTPEERVAFTRHGNPQAGLGKRPDEQARTDAEQITPDLLARFPAPAEAGLDEILRTAAGAAWVQDYLGGFEAGEWNRFVTQAGTVSESGIARIRLALLRRLFQGAQGDRILRALTESGEVKGHLERALFAALPRLVQLVGAIERGERPADYDVRQGLVAALEYFARQKERGKDPADMARHESLLGHELQDDERLIVATLAENQHSPARLAGYLNGYVNAVLALPPPSQGGLFAEIQPADRARLWTATVAQVDAEEDARAAERRAAEERRALERAAKRGPLLAAQPDRDLAQPPRVPLRELIAQRAAARQEQVEALLAEAGAAPVVSLVGIDGDRYLVHRETNPEAPPGTWKATHLDAEGVWTGHTWHASRENALRSIAGAFTAEGPPVGRPGAYRVARGAEAEPTLRQTYRAATAPDRRELAQPAYHGSAARFDRFSTDFIGSGEGAAAFGWGLYFASQRAVAEHYRETLAGQRLTFDGAPIESVTEPVSGSGSALDPDLEYVLRTVYDALWWEGNRSHSPRVAVEVATRHFRHMVRDGEEALERAPEHWAAAYRETLRRDERRLGWLNSIVRDGRLAWTSSGQLYEVDLPEDDALLDYDGLLRDQPDAVLDALDTLIPGLARFARLDRQRADLEQRIETAPPDADMRAARAALAALEQQLTEPVRLPDGELLFGETLDDGGVVRGDAFRGRDLYDELVASLGSPQAASLALAGAGIPGHRYRDHSSRGPGRVRHDNYVIYDDARIPAPKTFYQRAYHGGRARFERFSSDYIGSGEGNTAFGWGLYFATRREIAEQYRQQNARGRYVTYAGRDASHYFLDPGPPGRDPSSVERTPTNRAILTTLLRIRQAEGEGRIADVSARTVAPLLQELARAARTRARRAQRNARRARAPGPDEAAWGDIGTDPAIWDAAAADATATAEALEALDPALFAVAEETGQLYEVEVPDDAELLDYDAPLERQPAPVLERLMAAGMIPAQMPRIYAIRRQLEAIAGRPARAHAQHPEWRAEHDALFQERADLIEAAQADPAWPHVSSAWPHRLEDLTGADLYRRLASDFGSDSAASQALARAGIPGHRYLDGTSRKRGHGSYNYVLYDDRRVSIARTFYQPARARALVAPHQQPALPFAGQLPSGGPAAARVVAQAIATDIATQGYVELRGRTLRTAEDLAVLMRVYRDPRTETFRVVWVDAEQRILAHEAYTSGLPNAVYMQTTDGRPLEDWLAALAARKEALGAAGYWLLHNHPSGEPTPSREDVGFTKTVDRALPGLLGHVILDHARYGAILPSAEEGQTAPVPGVGGPDPLRAAPPVPHAILGRTITSPDQLVAATHLLGRPGSDSAALVVTDAQLVVTVVEELPLADLTPEQIRARRAVHGGTFCFGYGGPSAREVLAQALRADALTDALVEPPGGRAAAVDRLGSVITPLPFRAADAALGARRLWQPATIAEARASLPGLTDPELEGFVRAAGPREPGGRERGRIRIAGRSFKIELLEGADLSTFLHETGHAFLEILGDLAAREGASATVTADLARVLAWLGAPDVASLTTAQHEQFARAFEAYLGEGKPPTPELAGLFETFRRWILGVYRHLRALEVDLTDEVRGVFDRLLATDAEIESSELAELLVPVFDDARAAGATDAEWADYRAALARARQAAHADAARRVFEDVARARDEWYREARRAVLAEAAAELDADPVQRAYYALKEGTLPSGGPLPEGLVPLQFDSGALERVLVARGAADGQTVDWTAAQLRRLVGTHRRGGADPEAVAELFGFDGADALVQALLTRPPRRAALKAIADRRMQERHGAQLAGPPLDEVAADALHGPRSAEVLLAEQRFLARRVGGRPSVAEVVQAAARRAVGALPVKALRPELYRVAEVRARRAAREALARGDHAGALAETQRELQNYYLYRAARAAAQRAATIRDHAARLATPAGQKRLGRGGAAYVEQANALLDRYELARVPLVALAERQSLREWIAEEQQAGRGVAIPPGVLDEARRVNWREVPLDELEGVHDALTNIEHLARTTAALNLAQRERDFEAAVAAILERLAATHPTTQRLQLGDAAVGAVRGTLRKLDAAHATLEELVLSIDGDDPNGPLAEITVHELRDAASRERELGQKVAAIVLAKVQALDADSRRGLMRDKVHIRSIDQTLSMRQVLAVALNMGNASNRRKLRLGYQTTVGELIPWTQQAEDEILSHVTRAQWEMVQAVWDALDQELWPEIVRLQRDLTGIAPKKVPPLPFEVVTREGIVRLRGGYYPVVYDPRRAPAKIEASQQNIAAAFASGYVQWVTPHGFTKERIEDVAYPIRLDPFVLPQHVAEVTHDIAYRLPVMNAWRIVTDPRVGAEIERRMGAEYVTAIKDRLLKVANARVFDSVLVKATYGAIAEHYRSAMTASALAFNVAVTAQNLANFGPAIAAVGVRAYARGWAELIQSPVETVRWVRAQSPFMARRITSFDQNVAREFDKMFDGAGGLRGLDGARRLGLAITGYTDLLHAYPCWVGAYRSARAAGEPHAAAVRSADAAVTNAFGDGDTWNLSHVQDAKVLRYVTMFSSWFLNAVYRQQRRILRQTRGRLREGRYLGAAVWFAWQEFLNLAIPAIVGDLLMGRLRGAEDDEDYWFWPILSYLCGVPLMLRAALRAYEAKDPLTLPIFAPLDKALRALREGEQALAGRGDPADALGAGAEAVGYALGVPGVAQASRTLRGLAAESADPLERAANVVLGPPAPAQDARR